jgi:hypothetical protein
MVFVFAMISTALFAAGIAVSEWKVSIVISAPFVAYLVYTAMTTVRPLAREPSWAPAALMTIPTVVGLAQLVMGVMALRAPRATLEGVPAGMYFFLGTIALLAAGGDLRMMRSGGIQGPRRIARHLWRMCFGLFIASGSFFFGQVKFIPKPLRIMPLITMAAVAPLLALLYWMWRVRTAMFYGLPIGKPRTGRGPPPPPASAARSPTHHPFP